MSEDTDFTKEQWAVCPMDLTVVEGIGISGRIAWRVCRIYGSSNRKRQQETTRFIAAAPETATECNRLKTLVAEMLKALEVVEAVITRSNGIVCGQDNNQFIAWTEYPNTVSLVHEAIAMAKINI